MDSNNNLKIDDEILELISGGNFNLSANAENAVSFFMGQIRNRDFNLYKKTFDKLNEMRMSDTTYSYEEVMNLVMDALNKAPSIDIFIKPDDII